MFTPARSNGPWPGGKPPRRRPKAADPPGGTAGVQAGGQAPQHGQPQEHARRYELLRQVATGGGADGWRHGLGVLAAKGVACWMATWATLAPTPPPSPAGTTTQAEQPLSTTTGSPSTAGSPSAHSPQGGEITGSACTSFPPAATSQIVAVLAQMTLAHARSPAQKGPSP